MNRKKSKRKSLFILKRIALVLLVIMPGLLLFYPAYDLLNSVHTIFPAKDIQNKLVAIADKALAGNSVVEHFTITDGLMVLQYVLKEGYSSPMVFTTLAVGTVEKPFDLSGYSSVSIKVREATCKSITIFMKTFVPKVSLPEAKNAHTLRHNQYILRLAGEPREYTIGFDEFYTPSWWTDMMNVSDSTLPEEHYEKLVAFDFQFNASGSDNELGRHERVVIEEIAFHRSLTLFDMIIIGFLALYYTGLVVFAIARRTRNTRLKIPDQKPIKVASYKAKDMARIKEFVESHYNDPDISTRMLYTTLGIPQDRVFALVMSEYGLTFKQLINKMRIEEAKRMLKETDLRIIDIALNLGFNNISYFNNIFKANEGETPSDFRDSKKLK
jgi:AraC-like DNA-binding protein